MKSTRTKAGAQLRASDRMSGLIELLLCILYAAAEQLEGLRRYLHAKYVYGPSLGTGARHAEPRHTDGVGDPVRLAFAADHEIALGGST